jgi:hypothetical protein
MVLKFFVCLIQESNTYEVSACFFEHTYKFQRLFQKLHQISFSPFLCSHWSNFSSIYSGSHQAAFGTTIRVTGGHWKAGIWSLKRRIFTISKLLEAASRNFIFDFLHQKTAKKIRKTNSAHLKILL